MVPMFKIALNSYKNIKIRVAIKHLTLINLL